MFNISQNCIIRVDFLYTILHSSVYFFNPVKSRKTSVHRGEVLRAAVNNSGVSITVAAKRAGYSRSSYYNHVLDPELDFSILNDYGKAIRYDFSIDFPEMEKFVVESDSEGYRTPNTLDQAIKEVEKWRQKYYSLLEKYHRLIEEKIKR